MKSPQSLTAAISGRPAEANPLQSLLRFVRAARYRKGIMVVALVASGLLGGLYYTTVQRVYESKASLLVLQAGADTTSTMMSGERVSKDFITTYAKMASSEAVLEEAIKLLPQEGKTDFASAPRSEWIGALRNNLAVTSVRRTNILEIVYRSKEPLAAAVVVNSVVTAYLTFVDKLHKSTSREILDVLTKEKHRLEAELRVKEAELLAERARGGELVIRDGEKGVNVVIKRALSLNEALLHAQEQRLEAESRLVAIEAAIRNGEDLQQHAMTMSDSVGREVMLQRLGLSTPDAYSIAQANRQLLENKAELLSAQEIYGPAHSQVRELQERIRVAEQYLQNYRQESMAQLAAISDRELAPLLLQMARQQVQQVTEHCRSIQSSYEQEKHAAIELDRSMAQLEILNLDLNRLRRFYDVVVDRIKNVDLGQDSGMIRTAVLNSPKVPLKPVWPRLSTVGLLAILLGIAAGSAGVYVADLLDDRFRSPEELQSQLGLPILTMVRKLDRLDGVGVEAIHTCVRPNGVDTEAFRTLRTALSLSGEGARSIVVSSSEPGDGKTTVVANLAAAYAQAGKRTLVIDADMRRPGLTPLLNLRGQQGLTVILRQEEPIEKAARANLFAGVVPNLDAIPSGPRCTNPAELLAGQRLSELLSWAEPIYDQIVIDCPPAIVSDAAIIGRLVDGIVLTVRPEKNRRQAVLRTVESFPLLGVPTLGIVVNQIASEGEGGYYGYGYGFGYSYGYGYGHENEDEDAGEDAGEGNDSGHAEPQRVNPIRKVA